jgi:hypothetical protein
LKRLIIISFALIIVLQAKAQKHINSFLSDLGISDYKLNSTLNEFKKNKKLNHLGFVAREDSRSSYLLNNQKINFFDVSDVDEAFLDFEGDKLKEVGFEVLGDLDDGKFEQTYQMLILKYGDPVTSYPVKNSSYKTYIWSQGENRLILRPLKISFLVKFGEQPSLNNHWIYKERKGKGKAIVQLTLQNWEKLINSNLNISAFEKYLPEWQSTGDENHIKYDFNMKTAELDVPQFSLTYHLKDYDIQITTKDTISKAIKEYRILNIKDQSRSKSLVSDIIKSGYKIDKDIEFYQSDFYLNKYKQIAIEVTQRDGDYSFIIKKKP